MSVGPTCSSLKHKTSSGKLGHSSSASLIKCSSFLYVTVRSICCDLMLKLPAQIRLQMRPNACSTVSTLVCHIKCIKEREKREREERERVQAGESHHHGSCGVLLVLQCPVSLCSGGRIPRSSLPVSFKPSPTSMRSLSGFWFLISMKGESGRGFPDPH